MDGVDRDHPIVQSVFAAMGDPEVAALLAHSIEDECWLYALALHQALSDKTGWRFVVFLYGGDCHMWLRHDPTGINADLARRAIDTHALEKMCANGATVETYATEPEARLAVQRHTGRTDP